MSCEVCHGHLIHDSGQIVHIKHGKVQEHGPLTCQCKLKFSLLASGTLSWAEREYLHHTEAGPLILVRVAEYLGYWIHGQGRSDEQITNDDVTLEETNKRRAQQCFIKPFKKLHKRLQEYLDVGISIVDRILVWEVFMITLFSYITPLYDVDPDTMTMIKKSRDRFIGVTWWISTDMFRAACAIAGVRRKVTGIEAYATAQALGFLLRRHAGKVPIEGKNRWEAKLIGHMDAIVEEGMTSQGAFNKGCPIAKVAEKTTASKAITTSLAGKAIGRHDEDELV